ncbi:MAG TPA: hypothetical protein VMW83_05970 [Spirochaetia bacterium]|nr:hypothetical protein [Spirochaetia bacterium]
MGMHCDQCEQTAKGTACTIAGVCGKSADVAALQDLLIHAVKGLSLYATEARRHGIVDQEINGFTVQAVFSTVTNVDFDPERFKPMIDRAVQLRERLKEKVAGAGGTVNFPDPAASFQPAGDLAGLIKQGDPEDLIVDQTAGADIQSLQRILVYGLNLS